MYYYFFMSETTSSDSSSGSGSENSSIEGTRVQAVLLANACQTLLKGQGTGVFSSSDNTLEIAIQDMTHTIAKPENPFEDMIRAHCSKWEKAYAVSIRGLERQSGIGMDSITLGGKRLPTLFMANGVKYEVLEYLLVSPKGDFARAVEVNAIRPEDEEYLDEDQIDLMKRVQWVDYGKIEELKVGEDEDSIPLLDSPHVDENEMRRVLGRVLRIDETWSTEYEL